MAILQSFVFSVLAHLQGSLFVGFIFRQIIAHKLGKSNFQRSNKYLKSTWGFPSPSVIYSPGCTQSRRRGTMQWEALWCWLGCHLCDSREAPVAQHCAWPCMRTDRAPGCSFPVPHSPLLPVSLPVLLLPGGGFRSSASTSFGLCKMLVTRAQQPAPFSLPTLFLAAGGTSQLRIPIVFALLFLLLLSTFWLNF